MKNQWMPLMVRPGDVRDARLVALLEAHIADMYATSPPESVHTLDLDALAAPNVVVLTVWETGAGSNPATPSIPAVGAVGVGDVDSCGRHTDHNCADCPPSPAEAPTEAPATEATLAGDDEHLLGCGAVKIAEVDGELCGELKSMRTQPAARGRGVASMVLDALVELARTEGVTRLYLETGPQEFFAPARALYAKHGFVECGPFGDYALDPYSVFMTRAL